MNSLQIEELKIAKYLNEVCDQLGLHCFMLGGTLSGAVRHNGFIPWDDDMDFGLPQHEYEQLIRHLIERPSAEYNVKYFKLENTHDYPIKLESTHTFLLDSSKKEIVKRGAWIDIFPLDGMPNNRMMRKIHSFNLLAVHALFKFSQLDTGVAVANPTRTTTEKVVLRVGQFLHLDKVLNEQKMFKHLDSVMKKYAYSSSNNVINFMGAYKIKEMFPKEIYQEVGNYSFADTVFKGPKNYDFVLRQMYGNDYMLPPSDAIKNKHSSEILKD